jgi:uncharacterized protein (DUF1778 family)
MATPIRHPKTENLTFRISPGDKALLESAITHIPGTDLTGFVLTPALNRAREIIKREEATLLTGSARERFIALMELPPAPSERLLRNLSDKRHQIAE